MLKSDFSQWLLQKKRRYWGVLAAAGAAAAHLASDIPRFAHWLQKNDLVQYRNGALLFLHTAIAAVCAYLTTMLYRSSQAESRTYSPNHPLGRSARSTTQLLRCFMLLFSCWTLFFGLRWSLELDIVASQSVATMVITICSGLAQNAQWFILWGAYLVLSEETSTPATGVRWEHPLFASVGVVLVYGLWEGVLPSHLPPLAHDQPLALAPIVITGLLNGVFLAMVLGRLDSKRLRGTKSIFIVLYLLAAIQPLFFLLYVRALAVFKAIQEAGLPATFEQALFGMALPLEVIFFLFIAWAYQSGRLEYYMYCMGKVLESDPADFQTFHELRSGRSDTGGMAVPPAAPPKAADGAAQIFVSSPMNAVTDFEKTNAHVNELVDGLNGRKLSAYYAGRRMKSKADFNSTHAAFADDLQALASAKAFVMVVFERVPKPSGAFVEAGCALALGKPSLYLVCDIEALPFMLRGAEGPQGVTVREGLGTMDDGGLDAVVKWFEQLPG